jgi:Mor family transcriptional regulator
MARKPKAATIRRGPPIRKELIKRNEQIRAYRGRGWTYQRLADKYDLSLSRITQILSRAA